MAGRSDKFDEDGEMNRVLGYWCEDDEPLKLLGVKDAADMLRVCWVCCGLLLELSLRREDMSKL